MRAVKEKRYRIVYQFIGQDQSLFSVQLFCLKSVYKESMRAI